MKKIAIFVDGSNMAAACHAVGFRLDFAKVLQFWQNQGEVVEACYFTALPEPTPNVHQPLRKLTDWLTHNGWRVFTKPTKEMLSESGLFKLKGNMDVEIAVKAVLLAGRGLTDFVLFSGDGDFRYLVEVMQHLGVDVTVVSHYSFNNSTVSNDLRKQVNTFMNLIDHRSDFELRRKG